MNRLEQLLEELCPEGVAYRPLGEVCHILDSRRKPVTKKNRTTGKYPYYGANGIQDYVNDYIFDGTFLLMGEDGSVIHKDKSPILTWAVGKIWVNNHAHILSEKEGVLLRFLYYYLQTTNIGGLVHGTPPKMNQQDMRSIEVPIPPLPIQTEIVRILDHFSELTEKLAAELAMRRKQYDYYRQFLLCLDNNLPSASIKERHAEISWRTLGEISRSISSGRAKTKDKIGMYPVYGSTGMIARTNKAVYKKKNILVARVGSAGYVYIAEGEYDVSDNTLIIDLKDRYNLKYIYYQLVNIDLRRYAKGGVQPLITGGEIKRITLPFPSEEEQARIVSILDRFDALVGDPTSGLPAEIEARRKQYEYYRNKLLDFNRGGAPPWTTLKSDRRSASCEKRSISPSSSLQRR